MNKKALRLLQYILLLGSGVLLSWLFFRNLNFEELKQNISNGNFAWFYLVMLVSVAVYVLRVLRWQMLIKAMDYKTGFFTAFSALSLGYFVNFVVPRLGEVTRCLSVKKQSHIPFMQLLGTVIIERVIDILCLFLLLLITLLLQFNQIIEFTKEQIFFPLHDMIIHKIHSGSWVTFAILLAGIVIVIVAYNYFKRKLPKFIVQFFNGLKQGLTSIASLKQKRTFILCTLLIWLCYYLMTYFWFFVFKETSVLSFGACLTILSIGTIGRSIPIQGGGMGAYHFLVAQVIMLYGMSESFGKTLAILIHAGQTFFTFAMGIIGLIIFLVNERHQEEKI